MFMFIYIYIYIICTSFFFLKSIFSIFPPTPLPSSNSLFIVPSLPLCFHKMCLPYLHIPLYQTVGEREADIKRLKEQLSEANQANEASQATQAKSFQASDANTAGDTNQAQQEEVAKLRQEVLLKVLLYSYLLYLLKTL